MWGKFLTCQDEDEDKYGKLETCPTKNHVNKLSLPS